MPMGQEEVTWERNGDWENPEVAIQLWVLFQREWEATEEFSQGCWVNKGL